MRLPAVFLCLALLLTAPSLTSHALASDPGSPDDPADQPATGSTFDNRALLPPELPWDGSSTALALAADSDDPWITPSERSGLRSTPSYDDTVTYLRRLVESAPELRMVSLGKSSEGRDIWLVIASSDGAFTPEALRTSKKPVALLQAGIHAGEIDGKDAGLMLLRDMTVKGSKRHLLQRTQVLFVPIFNVDGHEHSSPHGRINQRGPTDMGWRTTARNLNLNRDYAKAETPEMQAMLRALDAYRPDLYVDLHVTDGIDYQYDITWGYAGEQTYSPATSRWLREVLDPPVTDHLREQGHIPGYLVFAFDPQQPDQGLFMWSASSPRYSDGYGSARHLPTILVENHSLKPYRQRVLGTYVLLEAILETLGEHGAGLRQAAAEDRQRRPSTITLGWQVDREQPLEQVEFAGVEWRYRPSEISGRDEVEWLGKPVNKTLPRVEPTVIKVAVDTPLAYWVPAAWPEVIERLELHGIAMERLTSERDIEVELYRVDGATLAPEPFEGRARVRFEDSHEPTTVVRSVRFAPGSARVPMDQPLGELAALLLEPLSEDSFFQWGFFLEALSRTEYVEAYVMAPTAERMLRDDPQLVARFSQALDADPELAADPQARLQWFYRETPFFDQRWRLYPVGREVQHGRE